MTLDQSAQWLILGRYRVLGELGRGAMGIVYKVHDERLDRIIALKTIRKDVFILSDGSEQDLSERFRREARAAGKLTHPGIVTIYDSSEEGDDLYIAMECVEGECLGERMRRTPRMPVGEASRIATRVCEAIAYAHAHGVVHRDVKPDNIMCCANGDVKLTDFGIARIISQAATRTVQARGTPRYMAPEQWRGDSIDGRADVYAIGIILYEMLTGRAAFPTKSPSELKERVLHEEPVLPTLANRALPIAINPVVRRAIAREPGDRYATADELARALAPFVIDAGAPPHAEVAEGADVPRREPQEATGVEATLPGGEPSIAAGRMIAVAAALAVVALAILGTWARQPRRSLPMPPAAVATAAAPVAVARVEETSRAVVPTVTVVAPTATAAAPTPEVASTYREARVALADSAEADSAKLALIDTLAGDAHDAATDVLLDSTRNPSILVSMAAVKALAGRPCARVAGPLATLLDDEEWQRRAWAAKILGGNGCGGARDALAMRRGREGDARVTKLMEDAIRTLDEEGTNR
jgi:tRNA A-37 threonylcarbamoyl transferase component Bud32